MSDLSPRAKRDLDKFLQLLAGNGQADAAQAILRALRPITGGGVGIAPTALPAAGGDLSGTLGAATVVAIQNQPVSTTDPLTGQAPVWDGSAYVPTTVATPLTVQEVDGTPSGTPSALKFPNGTLTDNGDGSYTYTPASSGTALTIAEIDGTPSGAPTTLQFPNGTVTDQGGGVYRYTPAAGTDTDEKAKVSSNDTTPGYLNGKLVAGTNVTLTENNDGANETLTIAAAGGGVADATFVTRTAHAGLSAEVLLADVEASELKTRWEPLTNGDPLDPQLVFGPDGDCIMVEVAI